jgi:hypothetical protein
VQQPNRSGDLPGDFTTTTRVLPISILAVAIGVLAFFAALALLRLMDFSQIFFITGGGALRWYRRRATTWEASLC